MQPGFLLITTDQHRTDGLGCYGNPFVSTPHLDRLAAEGVRLERAYATNPLCMPSRASILTGCWPRAHRVWCNGVPLSPELPTLPGVLAAAGYATACVGKLHFTPYGAEARPGYYDAARTWNECDLGSWQGPYYGFQWVQLTIGHVDPHAGHYGRWLGRQYPAAREAYRRDRRLGTPAPSGAPETWASTLPLAAHHSPWIAARAEEFLARVAGSRRPWFLWVSFPDPHHPFRPPAECLPRYAGAPVPPARRRPGELDDKPPLFREYYLGRTRGEQRHEGAGLDTPAAVSEEQRRDIVRYTYAMITLVDDQVGRLLAALRTLGLEESTVVSFTSDHGELLGDHGLYCKGPFHYEPLLRVPWLWRWPARFPGGRVCRAIASLADLAPTVLDLAGLSPPPTIQGLSLARLLRGTTSLHRPGALIEMQSAYRPWLNLKTWCEERYKLTCYAGQPCGELYDLEADPDEYTNLYLRPQLHAVRTRLRERLLEELVLTEPRLPPAQCHA